MREDKKFMETLSYVMRQMTWDLHNECHLVNEKRIRRLIWLMGLIVDLPEAEQEESGAGSQGLSLTCCVGIGPIRSGAPPSPICQCGTAFCIW